MELKEESKLFTQKLRCVGKISDGIHTVDDLHITIIHPVLQPDKIKGLIYINNPRATEGVIRLFNSKVAGLTLEAYNGNQKLFSDELSIKNFSREQRKIKPGKITTSITLSFELRSVKFIDSFESKNDIETRTLSFFLAGPSDVWQILQIRYPDDSGNIKIELKNSSIDLGDEFDISIFPWHFYDRLTEPYKLDVSTSVLALRIKTDRPRSEIPDNAFLEYGQRLADDLLLLSSFLSKHWIAWYGYNLITADRIESFFRQARKTISAKVHGDEFPIKSNKIREFLKKGLVALHNLREDGLDLTLPITYYIVGHEARYVEERFTTLFLALEKIKDLYASKNELDKTLNGSAFGRLKSKLSKLVKQEIDDAGLREKIIAKLPDLNRPPLRFTLESLFDRYSVKWQDIYPDGSDLTLIRTRDFLFHSSSKADADELIRELNRLEIIMCRLLLRMLGWSDLSQTAKDYDRKRLRRHQK